MDPDRLSAQLLELAEREHELVAAGRADELRELHAERGEALDLLAPRMRLSGHARATLRHAVAVQQRTAATLAGGLDELGRELGRTARGAAAARGYTPAGRPPRRVLDRTA
jgi:hypothetical protein